MELTKPNTDINREVSGYLINAALDGENQATIHEIQKKFIAEFGEVVWEQPAETLHITLCDWIAPLVDYGKDKDELFRTIFTRYDEAMSNVLRGIGKIEIVFDTIEVTSGAIILRGKDNGQIQRIREEFLSAVELPPGTKMPPSIIHTSIARYKGEMPLEELQKFALGLTTHFIQVLTEFRLVHETKISMLRCDIIKTYPLNTPS